MIAPSKKTKKFKKHIRIYFSNSGDFLFEVAQGITTDARFSKQELKIIKIKDMDLQQKIQNNIKKNCRNSTGVIQKQSPKYYIQNIIPQHKIYSTLRLQGFSGRKVQLFNRRFQLFYATPFRFRANCKCDRQSHKFAQEEKYA